MDKLISDEKTGPPQQFAQKLRLSTSTMYWYLTIMRKYNAPIKYNRIRKTFFYTAIGRLSFHFQETNIPEILEQTIITSKKN